MSTRRFSTDEPELRPPPHVDGNASLGDLGQRLTSDLSLLVRQEIALARTEIKEGVAGVTRGGALAAAGAFTAILALQALVAAMVIGIGAWIGSYAAGALIVAVLLLLIGGALVMAAVRRFKEPGLVPEQTIESLQEDGEWITREIADAKRELT
jgi:uncharacterized membrane protein YqjE